MIGCQSSLRQFPTTAGSPLSILTLATYSFPFPLSR